MSTHAAIAIKKSSECIRWIYLHWDGDLNFAGRTLANHYLTIDKVKQLIMLGDLSSLHRWVEPPEGVVHNFDNRAEDVTVAYHRDRGECRHIGVLSPEVSESDNRTINALAGHTGGSYVYLFDEEEGEWLFGTTSSSISPKIIPGKFYPLDKVLANLS